MVKITTINKPWSSAIWKGSHNPILRGPTITINYHGKKATYPSPGAWSSKYLGWKLFVFITFLPAPTVFIKASYIHGVVILIDLFLLMAQRLTAWPAIVDRIRGKTTAKWIFSSLLRYELSDINSINFEKVSFKEPRHPQNAHFFLETTSYPPGNISPTKALL